MAARLRRPGCTGCDVLLFQKVINIGDCVFTCGESFVHGAVHANAN